MTHKNNIIYVVEEAAAHRERLTRHLAELGYVVDAFASAAAFQAEALIVHPCCLLLDVSLDDQSGFELQHRLQQTDAGVPIVFMTADGDIALGVRAMKAGAIDVLTKPLRADELLPALERAHAKSGEWQSAQLVQRQARALYARLTPRECEVFALVVRGSRNKRIADVLASRESTVKVHRSRLMRKLEAGTLTDLLRIGQLLALVPDAPAPCKSPRDVDLRARALPAANDGSARARVIARNRQPVAPMA